MHFLGQGGGASGGEIRGVTGAPSGAGTPALVQEPETSQIVANRTPTPKLDSADKGRTPP